MSNVNNSEKVEVSVVCLTYNHEKYIAKALEGMVNQQTNFNYEIIVHDDASTDSTSEIVASYARKYANIRFIHQDVNQYHMKDIMDDILFPIIEGEYIALCEGDDYWTDSRKLQIAYDALKSNQDCNMFVHRVACCKEDGSFDSRTIPEDYYQINEDKIFKPEDIARLLFLGRGYPFHTSSFVFKRENFVKNSPKNWVIAHRDIDLLKSSILNGSIIYSNSCMSTRRLNSIGNWNSTMDSQEKWDKLLMDDIETNERYDSYSNFIFHKQISKYIINSCMYLVKKYPEFSKEHMAKLKNVDGVYDNLRRLAVKLVPRLVSKLMILLHK